MTTGTPLADVFVQARLDTSRFGSDLGRGVSGAQRGFASRMGGMAKAAGAALGAGAAYGAYQFTKGAISLEAEFGKTMNQLQANLKAPKSEMKALDDLAMKMGADTVFSAKDASDAMLELARGGLSAAAIKGGALESALTLAAAGGTSMARSAEVMGNALHTFNLRADQSGQVAAALAGAANASSASIDSIALGLQQAGTVAADAGMSIQETTGSIAALANAGIAGSDAGTSLKTMFARLVPSTAVAKDAFQQYGLAAYSSTAAMDDLAKLGIEPLTNKYGDVYKAISEYVEATGEAAVGSDDNAKATEKLLWSTGAMSNAFVKANGEFRSMTSIAGTLEDRFGDMSASERAAALNTIFGSDARRAATVLTNEGAKGLARYIKATSDQTAADKQAAAATKGTAGAIERMKGSIETAQLAWGKAIKPITMFTATLVAEIANGAVPIIEDFGGLVKRNLGDLDLSGVSRAMKGIDLKSVASGMGDAFKGIGASLRSVDWGSVKEAFGEGASDTISVFAVAIGFLADHLDTLARYMPAVIAAFVLYKTVQATANVAALASLPIQTANVAALFASAGANRALATQMMIANGVEKVSLVTRVRSTVATIASTVAERAAAGATRAWAATQWLLNVALTANPIGLVVAALAALVIGLVVAWKKSDTFRKIVTGAFDAVKGAAVAVWDWIKANWKTIFVILTGPFGLATTFILNHWQRIKDSTKYAVLWVADKVLWMADKMLGAMATAFSWVPGLGDKLKRASDAVKAFREDVNREMDGIKDEEVNITFATGRRSHQENTNSGMGPQASGGAGRRIPAFGGPNLTPRVHTDAAGVARVASDAQAKAHDIATELGRQWRKQHPAGPTRMGKAGHVLPAGAYSIGMPYHGYPGHNGADYPAPTGTPVFSPWAGRVTSSYDIPGSNSYNNTPYASYGRVIKIAHSNGLSTLYGHLSRRVATAGLSVSAGQMIGAVGMNGNATGPHLHFEVSRAGSTFNPANLGIFDRGGIMRGLGINLSGQPERVLTPRQTALHDRQTAALEQLAAGRGSGGVAQFNLYDTDEVLIGSMRGQAARQRRHERTMADLRR